MWTNRSARIGGARPVGSAFAGVLLAVLAGCGGEPAATQAGPGSGASSSSGQAVDPSQEFPDILAAEVDRGPDGTYDFDVTVSSPYDTAERYADGWRVSGEDGEVYGEHKLTHDHAGEQPFTRTQSGVEIPQGVTSVVVEGRDQANGYGGDTVTVPLPSD